MWITKEHLPNVEEKIDEIKALMEVEDDASFDEPVISEPCEITYFETALRIDGLVRRLNDAEILMPPLSKGYIWSLEEASHFMESLLLGFPVPGIFLAREESGKLLVIDGQQRLKTLQFFYAGYFNPQPDASEPQIFSLFQVQSQFNDKTYQTLEDIKQWQLDKTTIHTTIVTQDSPRYDNTTFCQIFERLNRGSQRLTPQEIRATLYHGNLMDFIKKLNQLPSWRHIFGEPSVFLKDEELILRFLAFYLNSYQYQPPLKTFLNRFAQRHRYYGNAFFDEVERLFTQATDMIWQQIGDKAFKPKKLLNTAMFDSVMVGLARAIKDGKLDESQVKPAYEALLNDEAYMKAISDSTASEKHVKMRLDKATEIFKSTSSAD